MTAPFARRRAPLLERRVLGRYVVLVTADPLARARPGQFYMLAAAERWGGGEGERPFLARAQTQEGPAAQVTVAVADAAESERLITDGVATGGMQAKLNAALAALRQGVGQVRIAHGSAPGVLKRILAGETIGTRMVLSEGRAA